MQSLILDVTVDERSADINVVMAPPPEEDVEGAALRV